MPSLGPRLEIVDAGPYTTPYLNRWDALCLRGIAVFTRCFDPLLSCFVPTTKDLLRPIGWYLYVTFALPFWAICTILTIPIGLLFFLLWVPISNKRKPYRYSYVKNAENLDRGKAKKTYTCATTNVCIMHEVLTRFNNQRDTFQKAQGLGRNIATHQLGLRDEFLLLTQKGLSVEDIEQLKNDKLNSIGYTGDETSSNGYDTSQNGSISPDSINNNTKLRSRTDLEGTKNDKKIPFEFDHSILSEFPDLDFLLVQETWELGSSREFIRQLHHVFPYIVYDARVDSLASNYFLANSGTMIASRYPLVDVDFDWFRCSYSQCKLACKGLLQVKVSLGTCEDGRPLVGYLFNTHLQAYQGVHPVHARQMDDVLTWTHDFRRRTHLPNEKVAFDLCGGDFNTDNMSPVDEVDWKHPLFDVYEDVCRLRPGSDQDWTVGTEMRHTPLHDRFIQTPLGLQMALQHPALLQHYVLNADIKEVIYEIAFDMPSRDKHGRLQVSPVGGRRRIDYVLYRKGDRVKVKACNAVTQLAGLTDHVPYCLTFDVAL